MKYLTALAILLLSTLSACQKSKNDGPADLFEGKKLEGKWLLVKSTVQLKFDDGSVQNASITGEPGDILEFTHSKTVAHRSEGTFVSAGFGIESSGTWSLAQDKAELDFIYGTNPAAYQFRRIDELTDNNLVMSADDKMVLLIYETNDVNPGGANKKLVGGSVFEQYKR
jgi:hypothetical protein